MTDAQSQPSRDPHASGSAPGPANTSLARLGEVWAPSWPWIAAMLSGAMLAAAHASEHFLHFYPCALCLRQREAYWVAIGVALGVAILAALTRDSRRRKGLLAIGCVALALIFLAGAGIAAYHSLVEWGLVAAPAGCAAASSADIPSAADIMAALSKPMATASCTEAPFRVIGLSMAGYNALAAFGLAMLSLAAAWLCHHNKGAQADA